MDRQPLRAAREKGRHDKAFVIWLKVCQLHFDHPGAMQSGFDQGM